jgi:acyl-CoA thioesterase-1
MLALVTACSPAGSAGGRPGGGATGGEGTPATGSAPPSSSPQATGPLLVVIGDSYSEGFDNSVVWPELFADARGYRLDNLSHTGTGYVNEGRMNTFGERIAEAEVLDPSIIMFAGSRNDILFAAEDVRVAAEQAFEAARDRFPEARLIAIGPIWDSSEPSALVREINDAVAAAAAAREVEFIDALAANWLQDPAVIHFDGIHATDEGQQDLADGVEAAIANLP